MGYQETQAIWKRRCRQEYKFEDQHDLILDARRSPTRLMLRTKRRAAGGSPPETDFALPSLHSLDSPQASVPRGQYKNTLTRRHTLTTDSSQHSLASFSTPTEIAAGPFSAPQIQAGMISPSMSVLNRRFHHEIDSWPPAVEQVARLTCASEIPPHSHTAAPSDMFTSEFGTAHHVSSPSSRSLYTRA